MSEQTTIAEKLEKLSAGLTLEQRARIDRKVEEFMCPCLADKTCQWPRCAKIGDGIGHYP